MADLDRLTLPPVGCSPAPAAPRASGSPVSGVSFSVAEESDPKVSISRQQLVVTQQGDPSLAPVFDMVDDDVRDQSTGCFLRYGVFLGKWMLPNISTQDWGVAMQFILLQSYRKEILKLAHDTLFAGHLAVKTTYNHILQCFFWPGLKGDEQQHCKTCHICPIPFQ